ncbi:choline dehydrogenase [Yersinia entomophaga]|uniref:Choline dehydrogenase n=1 Tax=Yersinia entomophaga TaxID=935293 RepID=A0ABN4PW44_YERET|nr:MULTISPECIES: GMC family oxidoreductase [Yersinia]ANI31238.1 choline dehydrogenase [Yersinia entomophaga]OWF90030.1 choline dehydrogenase [Yersinia entomophaga]
MADTLQADVIVIGSGVAGGLVAHQLALAGKSVLILEAGPRLPRWEIVENFRNQPDKSDNMAAYPSTPYAPHPEFNPDNHYLIQKGEHPYDVQYIRAVGGTTWHWAASAWRFLPNDFKLKTLYGVGLDWPIDYTALEKWYFRAEQELGVWGPNNEDLGSPRAQPYPMEPLPLSWNEQRIKTVLNANGFYVVTEPVARNSRPYDGRPTCCGNNNCMPICPIGAMYNGITHVEKAERAGAIVRPQAVVYKLEVNDRQEIAAALFKDAQGGEHRAEGKFFVLAANGIEIPKIMLMSVSEKNPRGVGNSSDRVGRNLMDHPGIGVTFLANEALWPGRGPQEMTSMVGFRDGAFRAEYAAKKIHLSNLSRTDEVTINLLKQGDLQLGPQLEAKIRDRAARYVRFDSFHEILPHMENRIIPSLTEKDAIGIPKPEFYYAMDDYVRKSALHTQQVYADAARLMGGTEVVFHNDFANNNHITGTTIMGNDPKDSVVDSDCRTHDHKNLFIASSSVMPTVGSVNCTLTIAALSLRIAETLKAEV